MNWAEQHMLVWWLQLVALSCVNSAMQGRHVSLQENVDTAGKCKNQKGHLSARALVGNITVGLECARTDGQVS